MYDLLIKNGRVVDGTGMPSYHADVGIAGGLIADIGRLDGPARRTIDADGRAVAPGFIDNHCHFDAQVTWDPVCSFSPHHGVTTVIFGNCSLSLAPVREGDHKALAMMLSRVEAIPMESLEAGIDWSWTSFGDYLDRLDRKLGVNAGALVGHSAVRRYVMGEESQERELATPAELEAMKELVRDAIRAGALGLSLDRNRGHLDLEGTPIPAIVAPVEELSDLATALRAGTAGRIQCGSAYPLEIRDGFATRLSQASGRPVVYNQIVFNPAEPDRWKQHLALVEQRIGEGIQVYPVVNPRPQATRFTMMNAQIFDRLPTWQRVMLGSADEKKAAFRDAETRRALHAEAIDGKDIPVDALPIRWERIVVAKPLLDENAHLRGKTVAAIAEEQGKDVLDAFLDLVLEEDLLTRFTSAQSGGDDDVMRTLLASPHTIIGLSDAGAHVVFEAGYGYATLVLGRWVREEGVLSLEEAVRKLTFMQASIFGIHDRGLLRPGMAADVVVFDPDTVAALEPDETHDLPGGLIRLRQLATGVDFTIVNGQVLIEDGAHTGAYPGRVVRSRANARVPA